MAVGVGVQTLDHHLEDGVRATADGVVAGLAHVAVFFAALEQHEALGEVLALELLIMKRYQEALDVGAVLLVLVDGERDGRALALEQVVDLLVVDLNEGDLHSELYAFLLYLLENVMDGPGNDAREVLIYRDRLVERVLLDFAAPFLLQTLPVGAEHGVRLARARLAVSHYRQVVA